MPYVNLIKLDILIGSMINVYVSMGIIAAAYIQSKIVQFQLDNPVVFQFFLSCSELELHHFLNVGLSVFHR